MPSPREVTLQLGGQQDGKWVESNATTHEQGEPHQRNALDLRHREAGHGPLALGQVPTNSLCNVLGLAHQHQPKMSMRLRKTTATATDL